MKNYNDFICQCSRCHHGILCQYRTAQFGYSLEALITSNDYQNEQENEHLDTNTKFELWKLIYLSIVTVTIMIGFISNISSYVTLHHSTITRSSIIYCFICICISNQLCLISLVAQIIYILLNEVHFIGNNMINLILCKTISYVVKTLTYVSKWSMAYVSLMRLHKATIKESILTSKHLSNADKKRVNLF